MSDTLEVLIVNNREDELIVRWKPYPLGKYHTFAPRLETLLSDIVGVENVQLGKYVAYLYVVPFVSDVKTIKKAVAKLFESTLSDIESAINSDEQVQPKVTSLKLKVTP